MLQRYINYEYKRTIEIDAVETFPETSQDTTRETFQETSLFHNSFCILRNEAFPICRFRFAEDYFLL
jgi:hypothetical protein